MVVWVLLMGVKEIMDLIFLQGYIRFFSPIGPFFYSFSLLFYDYKQRN